MDPNEALARIRILMCAFSNWTIQNSGFDLASGDEYSEHCDELKELWDGLDDWLARGGFLPDEWSNAPTQAEAEAFASGLHGEHPAHFAIRTATALTKEFVDHQRRILRSLERSPDGVMLDTEDQMACVQLEEMRLVTGGDYILTENDGDWRYYFLTEAGKALVEAWRTE